MARPAKTIYTPINPEKYVGTYPIIARSSWERDFMVVCDMRDQIVKWDSEPEKIPYRDPLTGNQKVYIPDFLITMIDKLTKELRTRLIEIKPMKEQLTEHAKTAEDAALQARNRAKWGAAIEWCARRGIEFDVFNEGNLFLGGEKTATPTRKIAEYTPGITRKGQKAKAKKTSIPSKVKAALKKRAKAHSTRVAKARKVTKAAKVKKS